MYKREKRTGKEIIAFDGYWELQANIMDKPLRAQYADGHRPYVAPVSIPCFISMLQERWLLFWLGCGTFDMNERSKVPVLVSCRHFISLDKKRCSIWQFINLTRLRCIHDYRPDVRQTHQNARLERPCDKLASRLGVGKGSCNALSSFRVASGAGVFT